jgi:phytoene desaturase
MDLRILKSLFRLEMLKSIRTVIHRGVKNEELRSWLSFPVLFLGAKPSDTPALYSLMNYADMELGTWYPRGGMTKLFEAFYKLALEKGVRFSFDDPVESIRVSGNKAGQLVSASGTHSFDYIISAADYHHTDSVLLPREARQYSDAYWDSRKMAPGSLIFYLGVRRKLPGLLHHNLFFDSDFNEHAADIYDRHCWPQDPLFYVCMTSATDDSVAPAGHENIFILMPIAAGLQDDEAMRRKYLDIILDRMEARLGYSFRDDIGYQRSFCTSDFIGEYHSFKGNAYGLANTLDQTAFLKPRVRHKKIRNLFFAGQLAHPGPGLPPSMISGQITARLIQNETTKSRK